jgi:hypothetical protein
MFLPMDIDEEQALYMAYKGRWPLRTTLYVGITKFLAAAA